MLSSQLSNFVTIGYFISMVLFVVYLSTRSKAVVLGATGWSSWLRAAGG
jgi:hypothetical protein